MANGGGGLEFVSSVWYGGSAGLKALREETDSWSPISWVDLGYEWIVNEVSITEEGFTEVGLQEREGGRFLEVDELGCAWWCNNAEIELDVDLVLEEDDVSIGLDLKLWERDAGWEDDVDFLAADFLNSKFSR